MSLLKKLVFLLLLTGFYGQSYAAVDSFDPSACSVFSEAESGDKKDGKKGDKKDDEEEPDCE